MMKFARPALAAGLVSIALASSMPARAADIVDTAAGAGQFKTLVAAVKAAGLVGTLKGKGPFTVFAPSDDAFAKLPKGTVEGLLKPENKGKLQAILKYHVVAGKYDAARITASKSKSFGLKSVEGSSIPVRLGGGVKVASANVVKTDVGADNGVIHVIDSVIMPPMKSKHH